MVYWNLAYHKRNTGQFIFSPTGDFSCTAELKNEIL